MSNGKNNPSVIPASVLARAKEVLSNAASQQNQSQQFQSSFLSSFAKTMNSSQVS